MARRLKPRPTRRCGRSQNKWLFLKTNHLSHWTRWQPGGRVGTLRKFYLQPGMFRFFWDKSDSVESLQSHLILTMSHWSSGLPVCFPSQGTQVQTHRGVIMWNRDSPLALSRNNRIIYLTWTADFYLSVEESKFLQCQQCKKVTLVMQINFVFHWWETSNSWIGILRWRLEVRSALLSVHHQMYFCAWKSHMIPVAMTGGQNPTIFTHVHCKIHTL